MRRVAGSRSARPDLLPPVVREGGAEGRWGVLLVDAAAQMAELADLVDRGLVSPEEFERQRRKVFGSRRGGSGQPPAQGW